MQDIHSRFRDVDHVADANGFFRLLDAADGLESVQAYRRRMLELVPPAPGSASWTPAAASATPCPGWRR